jgi:hypothetical protein
LELFLDCKTAADVAIYPKLLYQAMIADKNFILSFSEDFILSLPIIVAAQVIRLKEKTSCQTRLHAPNLVFLAIPPKTIHGIYLTSFLSRIKPGSLRLNNA